MQFSSLLDVVTMLLNGTKLSFSVYSTSDIFKPDKMYLPPRYQLHSVPFCGAAKTTTKGLNACLFCKKIVNWKAAEGKKPFFGPCIYGIMEYVHPVVIDGSTKCVLYIGNMLMDRQFTEEKIRFRCRKTGVSPDKMMQALESCETNADLEKIKKIAQIIDSYIQLLSSTLDYKNDNMHWAVYDTKQKVDTYYSEALTLKECADRLFINEKYLGRIFKEQVGMSFHEYLNYVRLWRAQHLLNDTTLSISVIAYECGFSNISYFNRLFKKLFHATPSEFQKSKKPKKLHLPIKKAEQKAKK